MRSCASVGHILYPVYQFGAVKQDAVDLTACHARYFAFEPTKLDQWAEDVKTSLEIELKDLDK